MADDASVEPACGSKMIWSIACAVSGLLGLIFVIVAVASVSTDTTTESSTIARAWQGGCDCAGECITADTCKAGSTSYMNGCDLSDQAKCSAAVMAGNTCGSGDCNFGGLSTGLFFFLLFAGIIGIILAIVFSCGICACCCFAPDKDAAMAPAAAAPVAAPALAAPAVAAPVQ
jgi:hypothetical protein